jgi:hypothetical protein
MRNLFSLFLYIVNRFEFVIVNRHPQGVCFEAAMTDEKTSIDDRHF